MQAASALAFADQLRDARATVLRDSEAFEGIIHVVERLGSFLLEDLQGLAKYQDEIEKIAEISPLAMEVPRQSNGLHMTFPSLYNVVRIMRNDALHQGAFARNLATHTIEMSLILEDALRRTIEPRLVCHFMVRNPICAELWQPLSFVRQQMLAHSFSFLPVQSSAGDWYLLSDVDVVRYLGHVSSVRNSRLCDRVSALLVSAKEGTLQLKRAETCTTDTTIEEAAKKMDSGPLLVFLEHSGVKAPVGILTAFDIL